MAQLSIEILPVSYQQKKKQKLGVGGTIVAGNTPNVLQKSPIFGSPVTSGNAADGTLALRNAPKKNFLGTIAARDAVVCRLATILFMCQSQPIHLLSDLRHF